MTQLIDLGKLRFYFAGGWDVATVYESNDIVKYGGNIYVYTYGMKTSSHLPTDTTYWALMVEGFKFQAVYANATEYRVGDGVTHGGKVYICILDTTGNTPPNATYWSLFADGIQWEGEYVNATPYQKNDVVSYGGNALYISKIDTTGNLPSDATYWDAFVSGISAQGVYNTATAYVKNDVVAYGGNLYRATGDTTGNLPSNATYWAEYLGGIKFRGEYVGATAYALNDVVSFGSSMYRATTETTGNEPEDTAYWESYIVGYDPRGAYDAATVYYPNDLVQYGGQTYRCKTKSTGNLPTSAPHFAIFATGVNAVGAYVGASAYVPGDLVTYGANVYVCTGETTGNLPSDATYWELYSSGVKALGNYDNTVAYVLNDVVGYGGSLYRASTETTGNVPTDNTYWTVFQSGINPTGDWATATEYYPGDIVAYGGNTFRALTAHASATFATDLAASNWEKFNGGVKWRGVWATTYTYMVGDIVKNNVSSYICLVDHAGAAAFATDLTAAKWELFAEGGSYVLPVTTGVTANNYLTTDGTDYIWGEVIQDTISGPDYLYYLPSTTSPVGNTYYHLLARTSQARYYGDFTWRITAVGGGTNPTNYSLTRTNDHNMSGYQAYLSNPNVGATEGNTTFEIHAAYGDMDITKTVVRVVSAQIPVFSNTAFAEITGGQFNEDAARVVTPDYTVCTHTLASGSLPTGVTISADGYLQSAVLTGAEISALDGQTFTFTIKAVNPNVAGNPKAYKTYTNVKFVDLSGQQLFEGGTHTFTVPTGVTSLSMCCVGAGASGANQWAEPAGSGGGLGWVNNVSVTPGESLTVQVAPQTPYNNYGYKGGDTYIKRTADANTPANHIVAGEGGGTGRAGNGIAGSYGNHNGQGGGFKGDGGGAGGNSSSYQGGGGAGGYTGRGGNNMAGAPGGSGGAAGGGYYSSTWGTGAGGGVNVIQKGTTGTRAYTPWSGYNTNWSQGNGGEGGSGGANGGYGETPWAQGNAGGGNYGGGGGGPGTSIANYGYQRGAAGRARIIWGGGRSYPSNSNDI